MDHTFLTQMGLGLLSLLLACQPALPPAYDTSEFVLKPGFTIEAVAAEPLLSSPMAMTFDSRGRIWVVELPGYMRDIAGSEEEKPDGKIVILEDRDQDGRMDQRTVFLDKLVAPRALALVYGGLLFTDSPKLYWVPIEGDQPGERELVDSLYVIGGNIEHQPNGLLYGLDNWIYSAKSNARYRKIGSQWVKEATTFRGQWGISQDEQGRLFYNSNSTPLKSDFTFANQLIDNPYHKAQYGVNQNLDQERLMHPLHATSINRGYQKGNLDSLGRVWQFTSACGPLVYTGAQFPPEFQGNAFVCGPEGNLVKRYLLSETGPKVVAQSAYAEDEFLASHNETFRPVNLYTGPDGALYIVDLRKGIIQHRAYMSNYLHEEILQKGLENITGLGRIYKVSASGRTKEKAPDFTSATPADIVALLQHPNGTVRLQAQQTLIFGGHHEQQTALAQVARDQTHLYGQLHALWTLEGLDLLEPDFLLRLAEEKPDPTVLTHLLKLSEPFLQAPQTIQLIQLAAKVDHPKVDLQLCHLLGQSPAPEARAHWWELAQQYRNDPLFSEALVSGVAGQEQMLLQKTAPQFQGDTLAQMLQRAITNRQNKDLQAPKIRQEEFQDRRTLSANLYSTYCGTCHGADGKGIEDVAPPLYHSEYASESAEKLILIALNGMEGPVTVQGKTYELGGVMPGIRNNPNLSDEDIANLLRFVINALNPNQMGISPQMVSQLRAMTEGQETLFTDESLRQWIQENLNAEGRLPKGP